MKTSIIPTRALVLACLIIASWQSAGGSAPLCESKAGGRCFYISALTGNDTNDGSYTQPWRTARNIVSYYDGSNPPPKPTALIAGDVVYFLEGTYSDSIYYQSGVPTTKRLMKFRNLHGTAAAPIVLRAYPGQRVRFSPKEPIPGIEVLQCDHFILDGFEIDHTYGPGVWASEVTGLELRNLWVHEVDGVDNDNIAGIYALDVNQLDLHHCVLNDNYDRTCADTSGTKTANSRNLVLFGGGNVRVHHNLIFQSPLISATKTGAGMTVKHGFRVPSVLEVDHNVFSNCWENSIGIGYTTSPAVPYTAYVHHNLLLNSDGVRVQDFGASPAAPITVVITNNTFIDSAGLAENPALAFTPTLEATVRVSLAQNIIVSTGNYNRDSGVLTVAPYASDALYDQVATNHTLLCDSNCYFNPSRPMFWSLFAYNGGTANAYGTEGGLYDYASWQSLGYDTHSRVEDPRLNSQFLPQNTNCQRMGWAPWQDYAHCEIQSGSLVSLRFAGDPASPQRVEYADRLDSTLRWKDLGSVPATAGPVVFTDGESAYAPQRFYRIRRGP